MICEAVVVCIHTGRKWLSRFRELGKARDGASITLVAFAAPVVIGSMALAIDTGVWFLEKRKTQQMADSASLGAVRALKNGESVTAAVAVARNDAMRNGYVEETGNSLSAVSPPTSGPYAGQAGAVEVIVQRRLPLFFSRYLFGASSGMAVRARSVAYAPTILGKNLEVAMMLDVSSSMSGSSDLYGTSKLEAMKDAAKSLVDTVVQSSQTPYTSRVALVPYSSAVNVGSTYFSSVTGKSLSGSWSSVVERGGSTAFTDDAPGSGKWINDFRTWRSSAMGAYSWYVQGMSSNVPSSSSRLRPLSTDKTSLKDTIDGFTATGTTAGHVGIAWSWYVLSSKWSGIFTGTAAPNAYDPGTNKNVVLLSDFDMNSYYVAANGNSSAQALALCTAMKSVGITIYTVGYNVDTSIQSAVDLWNNCATDSGKVYSANTVSELVAAFEAIASKTLNASLTDDVRLGE
jgi:hypothetical protein